MMAWYMWRCRRVLVRAVAPLPTALLMGAISCSSPDVSGPASLDPSHLYWSMTLSAHAIMLDTAAPYDTLQLVAVPRAATGVPLADAPLATFTTSDSSLRVSATGLLTARAAASNVKVTATLTYQGIRLEDSAFVTVTALGQPPVMTRLQFELQPDDSAKIAAPRSFSSFYFPGFKTLQATALDATETPIPDALIAFQSSNPMQATVPTVSSDGTVRVTIPNQGSQFGPVTVYASATVYGVTLEDSVGLMITNTLLGGFSLTKGEPSGDTSVFQVSPSSMVVIGVGGYVWWSNSQAGVTDSLDVQFDDPSAASPDLRLLRSGGGDIPAFPNTTGLTGIRSRQFLRRGTFHWHSQKTGVAGTIVVQ